MAGESKDVQSPDTRQDAHLRTIFGRLGLDKDKEVICLSKPNIAQLMLPMGQPFWVRLLVAMQLRTSGYKQQIAISQVPNPNGPSKKFVPVKPSALAADLKKAIIRWYASQGKPLSEAAAQEIKFLKQKLTRGLADMEDRGFSARAVPLGAAVGNPGLLLNLTLDEAILKTLVKPLADFEPKVRGKMAARGVFLYNLGKPLSAKYLDFNSEVGLHDKSDYLKTLPDNDSKPLMQLMLPMVPMRYREQFAKSPDLAAFQEAAQALLEAKICLRAKVQKWVSEIKNKQIPSAAGHPDRSRDDQASAALGERAVPDQGVKGSLPRSAAVNSNGNGVDCSIGAGNDNPRPKKAVTSTAAETEHPDTHLVLTAMQEFVRADLIAAAHLVKTCRVHSPLCTAIQIVEEIRDKGPQLNGAEHPVKYLSKCVENMFLGGQPPGTPPRKGEASEIVREFGRIRKAAASGG